MASTARIDRTITAPADAAVYVCYRLIDRKLMLFVTQVQLLCTTDATLQDSPSEYGQRR